jgi:hypothetical protein
MLEFDANAMPDEDIMISTIPSVPVHSPGVEGDESEVSPSTTAYTPDSAEETEQVESMQDRFVVILTTFRNWKLTLDLPCVQAERDDGPEAPRVALADAQSRPRRLPRLSALGAHQGARGGCTDLVPNPVHRVHAAQPIRRSQHFPEALRHRAEGSSGVVHIRVHPLGGIGSCHSVSTSATLHSSNRVATSSRAVSVDGDGRFRIGRSTQSAPSRNQGLQPRSLAGCDPDVFGGTGARLPALR